MTYPLRHRPTCTGARPVNGFAGRYGDRMLYCADCQAVGHAAATEAASTPQVVKPARAVKQATLPPATRYVCGHHLDERVDHRGRGCRRCAQSRPAR